MKGIYGVGKMSEKCQMVPERCHKGLSEVADALRKVSYVVMLSRRLEVVSESCEMASTLFIS